MKIIELVRKLAAYDSQMEIVFCDYETGDPVGISNIETSERVLLSVPRTARFYIHYTEAVVVDSVEAKILIEKDYLEIKRYKVLVLS